MIRLWPVSAMNRRLPAGSASTLPGNKSGPVRGPFHLGGEFERCQIQFTPGSGGLDELADFAVEHVIVSLAVELADRDIPGHRSERGSANCSRRSGSRVSSSRR